MVLAIDKRSLCFKSEVNSNLKVIIVQGINFNVHVTFQHLLIISFLLLMGGFRLL